MPPRSRPRPQDAAKAAGAKRFVLVSALGAGDSLECIPYASHDVLKPWLDQKTKAEEHLQACLRHSCWWRRLTAYAVADLPADEATLTGVYIHPQASGMDYVVIRPGPLTDEATVSPAVLSVDACAGRAYSMMSREELGRVTAEARVTPRLRRPIESDPALCVRRPL